MQHSIQQILLWGSLLLHGFLQAEGWRTGAFLVIENEDMPEMADLSIESGDIAIEAADNEALYILNSNLVVMALTGPGEFRYERFEQAVDSPINTDFFDGESRMILEMKMGTLVIDTSRFANNAYIVLETPFGKLVLEEGNLFSVLITENKKRKRQSLEIECASGSARFLGREGQSYQLLTGQRLSGYRQEGSSSLGFSQVSYSGKNLFKQYAENLPIKDPEPYLKQFKPYMSYIAGFESKIDPISEVAESSLELRRPIIIKIAPRPPPRLPYRVIKNN